MIIVADTSPLNYLILIDSIDVLPSIYGEIIIPPAVQDEMLVPSAPAPVRSWMSDPPRWLEVRTPTHIDISLDPNLGSGEREAIMLAQSGGAGNTLIIDERLGRIEATRLGLQVTGTLGILEDAHHLGLLNFRAAMERLLKTNFKVSHSLLQQFNDLLK